MFTYILGQKLLGQPSYIGIGKYLGVFKICSLGGVRGGGAQGPLM